ncbi:hypothetical protein A3Q56_05422 [Intoshia linei]|uniref:Uncharacterized protein n=1 Tax=Intoshia linei TaxID=1819745 RepID=A0A177AYC8_9BILA|nr:hypothetical protein A3Q56_05422 [Intoshia linei]
MTTEKKNREDSELTNSFKLRKYIKKTSDESKREVPTSNDKTKKKKRIMIHRFVQTEIKSIQSDGELFENYHQFHKRMDSFNTQNKIKVIGSQKKIANNNSDKDKSTIKDDNPTKILKPKKRISNKIQIQRSVYLYEVNKVLMQELHCFKRQILYNIYNKSLQEITIVKKHKCYIRKKMKNLLFEYQKPSRDICSTSQWINYLESKML